MKKKPAKRTLKQARADVKLAGNEFYLELAVEQQKRAIDTCQKLQDALAQLKHIHALATVQFDEWSVKKRCLKLRQLMADIAQLSRREA